MDTKGFLYDASQTQIATNDDSNISGYNFGISRTLTASKKYYLKVTGYSSSTTGSYALIICRSASQNITNINPDYRKVSLEVTGASVLTKLTIQINGTSYVLNRPTTGSSMDTTISGVRFYVEFSSTNNGFGTKWEILARLKKADSGSTASIVFTFSKGLISVSESTSILPYSAEMLTGVNVSASNSLNTIVSALENASSCSATVLYGPDDIAAPSIALGSVKAATGMKILLYDSNYRITTIHYVVVFGDIAGGASMGDGNINSTDSLAVLQYGVNLVQLDEWLFMAADVNRDGEVDSTDANIILQESVNNPTINQNPSSPLTVPDCCSYYEPVTF